MTTDNAKRLLPWLVAVAFFMQSLDTTILNTAIPAIASALDVAPLSMKAVMASYTLSLAVFIPISGWTADRFGTRRVFAAAIGFFTLGSLLCGVSHNIHLLVACRVLQGFGGAMMVPVGRLTMVRTFPKSQLLRVMSFVAMPSLIGPMLGPVAGGVIIHYFHWSVIFFLNVPIGLAGLYLVYKHLPDYRGDTPHRLDVAGLALFGTGVALLSYMLEVFGEHFLSTREILGLLALSIVLLVGYGVNSVRTRYPLLRVKLFRIRTFFAAVVGSFVTRLGVGGIPFLMPLLYQIGLGWTPIQSGLMMVPQALRRDEPEAGHAAHPHATRLSHGADRQHVAARLDDPIVRDDRRSDAGVADRHPGVLLRHVHLDAVHEHEHARLCRRHDKRKQRRQHDREHGAADVDQFRRRQRIAAGGDVHSGSFQPRACADDPRHPLAFLMLGAMTMVSVVVFARLRADDGNAVSQHKTIVTPASETDQFVSTPSLGER